MFHLCFIQAILKIASTSYKNAMNSACAHVQLAIVALSCVTKIVILV
jgi:hypothetical protein